MKRSEYVTMVSRRTSAEPRRHAVRHSLARPAPGRTTTDARCGAQVAYVVDEYSFDTDHPRACPSCRKDLR